MINYVFRKNFYSGKIIRLMIALMVFAVVITFVRWYAVVDTIRDYAKAEMIYQPDHALFLWTGYTESLYASRASTAGSIAVMLSDFFPAVLLPLLLIVFGSDSYYTDNRAGLLQIIYTKLKMADYVCLQGICCVIITFLAVSIFFVFQFLFSLFVNAVFVVRRIPEMQNMIYTLGDIVPAVLRLSIYYATLNAVTYAASLFIKRAYVIILLLPVILSFGLSAILLNLFRNYPLALAFSYSNLAHPDMRVYWLFIVGAWAATAASVSVRLFIDRKCVLHD